MVDLKAYLMINSERLVLKGILNNEFREVSTPGLAIKGIPGNQLREVST